MAQYWNTFTLITPLSSSLNCSSNKLIASLQFVKASRFRRSKVLSQNYPLNLTKISCHLDTDTTANSSDKGAKSNLKKCLRCNSLYDPLHNSPNSCSFHAHINGEKGLYALAPPHQGIDGEWTDRSGVIVYKWNERNNRPNTGSANWKRRWSCCSEYDEYAPPCRKGWHVSYDDGFTLY